MRSTVAIAAMALAVGANAASIPDELVGTWSSGSGAVSTGGDFCSPAENKFKYPENTGISYSFTADGFFEEAQYRYDSNAKNPKCITGKIIWQHGTFTYNDNGVIEMTPWASDGRIQVQDPCAAQTNWIYYYNEPGKFNGSAFGIDPHNAVQTLYLNAFDGRKLPPLYLKYRPPSMLPTEPLTGTNSTGQQITKRDYNTPIQLQKRSNGDMTMAGMGVALAGAALSLVF